MSQGDPPRDQLRAADDQDADRQQRVADRRAAAVVLLPVDEQDRAGEGDRGARDDAAPDRLPKRQPAQQRHQDGLRAEEDRAAHGAAQRQAPDEEKRHDAGVQNAQQHGAPSDLPQSAALPRQQGDRPHRQGSDGETPHRYLRYREVVHDGLVADHRRRPEGRRQEQGGDGHGERSEGGPGAAVAGTVPDTTSDFPSRHRRSSCSSPLARPHPDPPPAREREKKGH